MMRFVSVLTLLVIVGCKETSIAAKEDPARLDRIATTYNEGDIATATLELEDYLTSFPRDALAWTILGHAYASDDRLDKAQSAYESALAVNPRQFKAITGLGIIHRKRGDYDAAMKAYEQAIAIDANYAQAYSSMTAIALKRHEDREALDYAKKGYDLDKTDPVIAANLAIAYHYNGDIKNRDKFTRIAEQLGYAKIAALQEIYSGEVTVRD